MLVSSAMTDQVEIYDYEAYDPARRCWARTDRMGTLDAIACSGCVPIHNSSATIDSSLLDASGFVLREVVPRKK